MNLSADVLDLPAALGQVGLTYAPMIDRQRAIMAMRLTLFPLRPEAPPAADALLQGLAAVWPDEAGRMSLNLASEGLLADVMRGQIPLNMMLEVPAFMACDGAHTAAIKALHGRGNTLLIKGRPRGELPREVLPCFAYSIVDVIEERRNGQAPPGGVVRQIPHVQDGVRSLAQLKAAFACNAVAVLGWPVEPAQDGSRARGAGQAQWQVAMELMNRVEREESIDRLEAVLKNDPTLAFRLLRYINSAAFGLRVEVASFRHALMLLGYTRLKRWLALLLASAGKDPDLKPVTYAAVRRGLLMEELVRGQADDTQRGEMFICGVFSLLDCMLGQPLADLLRSVPVPDCVRAALVDEAGPFQPYMALVRAVESGSLFDIRAAADTLLMSVPQVNRAVLGALRVARQLD